MKSPDRIRASLNHWQVWMPCGKVVLSKQLQPAMTNQLYTDSIASRKLTALVSFQSHYKSGDKQDYVTRGRAICAMRSRPTRPIAGYRDSGLLNTIIQLGERHSINVPDID